jgi:2-oxoglutarate dehydrogenase E2 component (dihydrolipoamide succinyltransferase)
MAVDVKIPSMGESITGGLLSAWAVKSGDNVKKGQALFSFETDKVTSDGTAEIDGQITITVPAGTEVSVGQVVASIAAQSSSSASPATSASIPLPRNRSPKKVEVAPAPKVASNSLIVKSGSFEASPAVRRIAAETGLNPNRIQGTGKAGRVTKGDMLTALDGKTPILAVAPTASTDIAFTSY